MEKTSSEGFLASDFTHDTGEWNRNGLLGKIIYRWKVVLDQPPGGLLWHNFAGTVPTSG